MPGNGGGRRLLRDRGRGLQRLDDVELPVIGQDVAEPGQEFRVRALVGQGREVGEAEGGPGGRQDEVWRVAEADPALAELHRVHHLVDARQSPQGQSLAHLPPVHLDHDRQVAGVPVGLGGVHHGPRHEVGLAPGLASVLGVLLRLAQPDVVPQALDEGEEGLGGPDLAGGEPRHDRHAVVVHPLVLVAQAGRVGQPLVGHVLDPVGAGLGPFGVPAVVQDLRRAVLDSLQQDSVQVFRNQQHVTPPLEPSGPSFPFREPPPRPKVNG